jgi:hypothetical protein
MYVQKIMLICLSDYASARALTTASSGSIGQQQRQMEEPLPNNRQFLEYHFSIINEGKIFIYNF